MGAQVRLGMACASIEGLEAVPVVLEAIQDDGRGPVRIEGLDAPEAEHLLQGVKRAMAACGFAWPKELTTISLSPMPRVVEEGSFGLPIAAALIALTESNADNLAGYLFIGGVTAEGHVVPPRGLVAVDALCRRRALTLVTGPGELSASSPWHAHRFITTLSSLSRPLKAIVDTVALERAVSIEGVPDFSSLSATETEQRAVIVACTGRHSLGYSGAPTAEVLEHVRRLPQVLSPLTSGEREIVERITSAAGESISFVACARRPLRAVPPTVTYDQMMGGGRPVLPGAVSLAHDGVLFLADVCGFSMGVLQGVRKAYTDKVARVDRAQGPFVFPADFMLVVSTTAAVGTWEDRRATFSVLTDLIDLHVPLGDARRPAPRMTSSQLATIVARGRAFRVWRLARAWEEPHLIAHEQAQGFVEASVRALNRVLKRTDQRPVVRKRIERVARTIADVEECEQVRPDHVFEAASLVNR